MKILLKKIIPLFILKIRRKILEKIERTLHDKKFKNQPDKIIFSQIYEKSQWGKAGQDLFFSGPGSRLPTHVLPYVKAVRGYLAEFDPLLNIADLGCGDFFVGSQIRNTASKYIACDVVPSLIEHNKKQFSHIDVDFRLIDIVNDPLPKADLAIIRQVLQHLSNDSIKKVMRKLVHYKYLIVTEYLPRGPFTPNVDQQTGAFSRLARGIPSGVILTESPFNMRVMSERVLCETLEQKGNIKAVAYEMMPHA